MSDLNSKIFTNLLIHETSPYLLQHAHNPVNWHPWGEAALQKALKEDKVILVSIGYAACHWCHVMERESFENIATAAVMNEHFICIKIDREERPDLDHIYMDAVQAISGSGGWPLNVFLTPETKPFFGGTYFPPIRAFNRSSWTEVLLQVAKSWNEKKHEIKAQAENLTDHINKSGSFMYDPIKMGDIELNEYFKWDDAETMFVNIMKTADTIWGGFGKAPKFPQTFTIQYLLQYYHFSGNQQALQQALLSIDKMLTGGIYDHVAGGLARYSTDEEWLAPHFEKMLYDNALLLLILCDAYQITKEIRYKNSIEKTIAFVMQELMDTEGNFYAALDADSEGVEGKFYVWDKTTVEELLGVDAALFCSYFDITENGNWEHQNILRILQSSEQFAQEKNIDLDNFQDIINNCLKKLAFARSKRIRPALDDKIILSWNALMLKAIAKAALVLQNEHYLKTAVTNFDSITKNLTIDVATGEMYHTIKNGQPKFRAFLDDYAFYVDACIQLYEATYQVNYLEKAKQVCHFICDNFSDAESVFFYFTPIKQLDIIVRKKEVYDGAIPSGNAIMAQNLLQLSIIFDIPDWGARAGKMLQTIAPAAIKYPGSFGIWASLLLQQHKGINEIAITGNDFIEIANTISVNYYIPNKILMISSQGSETLPMLQGKAIDKATFIYICKNYVCKAPVTTIKEFLNLIG